MNIWKLTIFYKNLNFSLKAAPENEKLCQYLASYMTFLQYIQYICWKVYADMKFSAFLSSSAETFH